MKKTLLNLDEWEKKQGDDLVKTANDLQNKISALTDNMEDGDQKDSYTRALPKFFTEKDFEQMEHRNEIQKLKEHIKNLQNLHKKITNHEKIINESRWPRITRILSSYVPAKSTETATTDSNHADQTFTPASNNSDNGDRTPADGLDDGLGTPPTSDDDEGYDSRHTSSKYH